MKYILNEDWDDYYDYDDYDDSDWEDYIDDVIDDDFDTSENKNLYLIKYIDPAVIIENALKDESLSDEERAEMKAMWDNEPLQNFVETYDVADWIFDDDDINKEYKDWLKDEFYDEIEAECKERAESDDDWEYDKKDLIRWINS